MSCFCGGVKKIKSDFENILRRHKSNGNIYREEQKLKNISLDLFWDLGGTKFATDRIRIEK